MGKRAAIVTVFLLMAISLALFGCVAVQPTGNMGGLMASDTNKKIDSNSTGKNSNVFNNLDQFRKVKAGDHVAVNYVGKLTDGNVFDSSEGRSPLEFDVGAGQMIAGFDTAVVGMKVGDTKTVQIPPAQAYGAYDPNKVITVDANQFPDFNKVTLGASIQTSTGYTGKVTKKTDTNVVIDFNHELAGKTLIFVITLVSLE